MNRTYSLVWSARLQCYAVASETTRRRGKSGGLKPLAAVLLSTLTISAHALPEGGQVSAGSGSIATAGSTTTISQQSQNMAINWQKFGTASNESIVFQQPNASAIALNRVLGNESSTLSGSLSANGQVWILNPNGVMFGAGSQVNVGGLLATTLKMSDDDFMSGKRSFSGTGGLVTNRGNITTTDGGYVALLGGQVSNEGVIAARLGTVALAAGNSMTLDFAGDKLLNVQVDQGALNALAQNKQLIRADGGVVLMTAKGVDALFNAVVNNDGVIEARTIGNSKGKIILLSDMAGGTTTVAGRLDASAPDGGDGGFIETSAAKVVIADGAFISTAAPLGKTGQWLIDPYDFTIAATGGNISGSTLSSNLGNGDVEIKTVLLTTGEGNGDIHVNDAVSWSVNTRLSLIAERDVNVNADITADGGNAALSLIAERNVNVNADIAATGNSAALVLSPGAGGGYALKWGSKITLSGINATLNIAGQDYKLIHKDDVKALQEMNLDLSRHYALADDVDASATSTPAWNGVLGFVPVGSFNTPFIGTLDGLGHSVSKLFINAPSSDYVGLFGASNGTILNLGVVDANITGNSYVGSAIGLNYGYLNQIYSSGLVSGAFIYSGGLAGYNEGTITNTFSTADITGKITVGGLVGFNNGTLNNVFATGKVNSTANFVGGLAGQNSGEITNAYARGEVRSSASFASLNIGGLIGLNQGEITNTYASGGVFFTGSTNLTAGILIGMMNGGSFSDSYASGTLNQVAASPSNLIGSTAAGVVTNIVSLTPTAAKQSASYGAFDFTNDWRIYEGYTTPLLRSLLIPVTVTANNVSKTYDGATYSGGFGYTISKSLVSLSGSTIYSGTATSAVNASETPYNINTDGFYSDRFDISYAPGKLTINQKELSISANNQSKTYGQMLSFIGNEFTPTGLVPGETINSVSLASDGSGASANVAGSPYVITASNPTGSSFNPANYSIQYTNGLMTVDPKNLSINLSGIPSKIYDGNNTAALSSSDFTLNGFVNGDSITVNQINGSYQSPNAGTNISVNAVLGSADYNAGSNTLLSNYVLPTSASGAGQITQASLQIIANDQSKTYGQTLSFSGKEFTPTGLVPGETINSVSLASDGSGASANVAGSPYVITASNATGGSFNPDNYNISYTDGWLTVNPATLTVTVKNALRTYSGTAFTGGNGVIYSGFVNGETATVVSGTPVYGGNSQGAVNAGTYAITLSGLSAQNYTFSFVNGSLVINPKQLAVSIIGTPTKVYEGNASAKLTSANYSISGYVGTDKVTINQTYGSYNSQHVSLANSVSANLSAANIVAGTGTLATNYLLPTLAFGAGRITPATLTYLADLRTLSFGSSIPLLTGTVTGFMEGDNLKNATTGTAVWKTTATSKSVPGKYAINGSGLTANYGDYKFIQAASNATALTIYCPTKTCR